MTEQEKYYQTMNVVTAPVRLGISLMKTALLLVLGLACCIGFPIYLLCNGEPVTDTSLVVSGLAILAIFTLCYAPYYTSLGGVVFIVTLAWFNPQDISANGLLGLVFAFFAFGILQRYLRHRLFDEPKEKPKQLSFVAQLNQCRLERLTRKYNELSRKDRDAMLDRYGDNYFTWPEPWIHHTFDSQQ